MPLMDNLRKLGQDFWLMLVNGGSKSRVYAAKLNRLPQP